MNLHTPNRQNTSAARISVIIPTHNEAGNIGRLVRYLAAEQAGHIQEVLVADGGSHDGTAAEADQAGARIIHCPTRGRAAQMNAGAEAASGDILYFLHADTFPPAGYDALIIDALTDRHPWGSFRVSFDQRHWFLGFVTWFTRLDFPHFRFGDQSLFVRKVLFCTVGGFNPAQLVFEDTDLARRLRRVARGKIIKRPVLSSARKFRENGTSRLCLVFIYLWLLYMLGRPHHQLLGIYRKLIVQDKI